MGCCPALCSVSQGEEEPFQRKLWGWQHPDCHSLSLRHCEGFTHCLGVHDSSFPSVTPETGSCLTICTFIAKQWARVLCEGKLNQVMELWQSTVAESWPLLCNLLGVYLWKECGGSPPSAGGLCHLLFAHRGPQIAVQWQSARCPGAGGIWIRTGYIPLNVFISRQQNGAPLYIWSSKQNRVKAEQESPSSPHPHSGCSLCFVSPTQTRTGIW